MVERLCSVGIDVGTTTTQLVFSHLTVENQASQFSVPQMRITDRQIIYRSPVRFTPLLEDDLVDAPGLRALVEQDYRSAGLTPAQVDTGAIIITGETSRKQNARAVLRELSGFAGEFVVTTAGPELESVLASRGAGAWELAKQYTRPVLHMDIGGGTSNMALLQGETLLAAGCMNVGGRLVKLNEAGVLTYVSPVIRSIFPYSPGEKPTIDALELLAQQLTQGLEMAAGLREKTELFDLLLTREVKAAWQIPGQAPILSFSGGVADCIDRPVPPLSYGDLGPLLGQAIRKSRLCRDTYHLGRETIRATVIGAGCHATQLSGSTVFCRGVTLPRKDLPVVCFSAGDQEDPQLPQRIRTALAMQEGGQAVLFFPGYPRADYARLQSLARRILDGVGEGELLVCLAEDNAKALGQSLCLAAGQHRGVLCLDGLQLTGDSYLDIGQPAGPCLPVVIKTLVLSANHSS